MIRNEKKVTKVENLEIINNTLNESYFLSSINSTYNGLLGVECTINLTKILREYSSILSLTQDTEEFHIAKRKHQSIILTSSHINYKDPETLDTSQIRNNNTFSDIESIVNRHSISRMSFNTKETENSIFSKELSLIANSIVIPDSAKQLNLLFNNMANSYENIENELPPVWNSIMDMSHIRESRTFSEIGSIIDRLSLSGISYSMGEMDNFSFSRDLSLIENSYRMSDSAQQLNWIADNIPKNYENIENELCPTFSSLIDFSIGEEETNLNLQEKSSKNTTEDLSKPDSINLLPDSNNVQFNFCINRKKKVYFPSPNKLINRDRAKESGNRKIKLNDSFSSNNYTSMQEENLPTEVKNFEIENSIKLSDYLENYPNEREEKYDKSVKKMSCFHLDDLNFSQWPCSTPKILKRSSESLNNKLKIKSPLKIDFGVSASNFFSRKKGMKYFNSPKK